MEHGCECELCGLVNVSESVYVWECKSTCEPNCRPVYECKWSGSHGTGVKAYIYIEGMSKIPVLIRISELALPLPASLLMPLGWISPLFIWFEKVPNVFLTHFPSLHERPPIDYYFHKIIPLVCLFFLSYLKMLRLLISSQLCKCCLKDKPDSQLGDIIHMQKTQLWVFNLVALLFKVTAYFWM